jgi:hypothetical protein
MMNAAVDSGLAVCIATGNNDSTSYIASPASADEVISVGASSHNKTLDRSDDQVTDFSNEGPRISDGDGDHRDEMKPTVVAPGAGILSADGDPSTDGTHYKGLSGTSMATPHLSGVCALIRQANPALTPLEIRTILENTAEHYIPSVKGARANDPYGLDANYNPGCGWGEVDAYAAVKEALNSTSGAQVVLFRPVARFGDGEVDVRWVTQREYPIQGFDIYRAPDVAGAPGAFVKLNTLPVAPTGHSSITGVSNRTPYVFVDSGPLVAGTTYWYRVAWVDLAATSHFEPAAPVGFGEKPRIATAYYSISHNEPENDLLITLGTSATRTPAAPEYFKLGPSVNAQDSSRALTPANAVSSTIGNVEHFWSVGFTPADGVAAFLPPSTTHPWFLNVVEGGYVNRAGRLNAFSMFVNTTTGSPSGVTYVTGSPTPMPTIETQASALWIPATSVLVAAASASAIGETDGVRLVVNIDGDPSGLMATVYRGVTADLTGREELATAISVGDRHWEYVDRTAEPRVTYFYWVELRGADSSYTLLGPLTGATSAGLTFAAPPYPNPARGPATFEYAIGGDTAGPGGTEVTLALFDLNGRRVREVEHSNRSPGKYAAAWDGNDASGRPVHSGIYYARFHAGSVTQDLRVVVVR